MDTTEHSPSPSARSTRETFQSEPAPLADQDPSRETVQPKPAPLAGMDSSSANLQPNPPTTEQVLSADVPPSNEASSRAQEYALQAKMRLLEEDIQRNTRLLADYRAQLNVRETTDADGVQRLAIPASPSLAAVARADHRSDQETTTETSTTSSTCSEPAPLAENEPSEAAPLAVEELVEPEQQTIHDEATERMRKAHALAVAKRRERLAAAAAQRQSQQQANTGTETPADDIPTSIAVPQPSVDTARTAPVTTQPSVGAELTTSRASQPSAAACIIPNKVLIDWTRMPAHMPLDEIWRRTRQFFSLVQDETGRDLARIDLETLASAPLRFPRDDVFWIQKPLPGIVDNSTWQPSVTCMGRDEPNCFHVSVGATLIIIKNTWLRYKQIAARSDLQAILEGLMRLHVRSFGQMILLVYAVRLAGNHDRMDAVLKFIDEVLRARDLDYDIAQAIQRHVTKMIRGVDAKKNPYPSEGDFYEAAERWCNYCYKAFLDIYERLSGPLCWSPEWLRNTDIPKEFKKAIDNIVMKAKWYLLTLKERVYKQYVLRHVASLEAGDTFYMWTPLKVGRRGSTDEPTDNLAARGRKWLLLLDEETNYAFGHELRNDMISVYILPSTNRECVLRCVRNIMPSPDAEKVYIWFGREYISNGNHDYGQVVTEICHHFTAFFSRVHQYVVLPPYTRLNPDDWTFDVVGLYMQREQLVPHARVVLHPYDIRLWHRDQRALQRHGRLPVWDTEHQSADGTISNWSTIEARKYNLREYHESDLWTWYKKDHRAHDPPASIGAHVGQNGRLLNSPYVDGGQPQPGTSTSDRPSEEEDPSCRSGNGPSTSAAATTSTTAPAVPPPQQDAQTSTTIDDVEVAAVLLREDNALLAQLTEYATGKAAERLLNAVEPRIDDLARRIDALINQKATTATAEDRHKEPRTEE